MQAAEEDFTEIITYIALDHLSAAEAMAEKIERSLSNLSIYPLIAKIPDEEELATIGYRSLVVQNYLIFYTIEAHTIWVHRISWRPRLFEFALTRLAFNVVGLKEAIKVCSFPFVLLLSENRHQVFS